ncbi:MAG: GlsB/YeaQ/YmgE family stress response membrane protein [Cyanobacteria bacterium SZAS LIN-2]|nr:GlsB/YeaQ/YmgE family stress response membrane protein [Cyanobacteria bacterium SZAS LIN-3]MBS1996656.1 GlsB/YeaQ/YmgE family stress response membrane protein [Cyanobacteria bacterium SZAS LIN-2]MBS2007487.1 GlsB/YeaQ/YmgE family stress response membrane protein [Cyanobacteria bacterium SZAS TMP-1]
MGILSFILFLFVAAACAYLAERLVPGSIPGGFLTSAIVGIIGAWVGGSMVGQIGPSLAGVSLLPCILGSALLVFLLSMVSRGFSHRNA